jgi:hypothetical protein
MKISWNFIFFLKHEICDKIMKEFQNNNYLVLHLDTKVFHLGAHIHVLDNIDLCPQLLSILRKLHIELGCWGKNIMQ